MKSLIISVFTLLFFVVCFATATTATASSGNSATAVGNSISTSQHSWKPVDVWCYDYMGNFRRVTQCDESGGACSDQYCPCHGLVIET